MTGASLGVVLRAASPEATVFAKVGDKLVRVDDVILSGVDPVVTGLTTVALLGKTYVDVEVVRATLTAAVGYHGERCECAYCVAVRIVCGDRGAI